MIRFKIDVIEEMKKKGYNTNRIRKEKIISESTLDKIRQNIKNNDNVVINTKTIDTICQILNKQPSYFLEYVKEDQ
jgi:putative transcriptional regulator